MATRMSLSALIVIFLTVPSALNAQVTMEAFILSARSDFDLLTFEDQIGYLDKEEYRLSPLQRTEIRTQSKQLDPSRQQYAIRLTPSNPWEVRNNSKYFAQYKSVLTHEKGLALKDALLERYNLVVAFIYYSEVKNLRDEVRRLTDLQVSVLERQRNSDFFKGEGYIELKLDQMDNTVEAEEAAFELDNHVRAMSASYPALSQNPGWKDDELISVERIGKVIDSLLTVRTTPATLLYRDSQIELANREYKLEKANVNFGFVQTEYENYRIEQGRKPWSISAGVTIPLTNPNKGDLSKRKLEVIEAEHKRKEAEVVMNSQLKGAYNELKSLLTRHQEIRSKIKALNVGGLSETLNAISEENPVATIRFQSNLLKLKAIEIKMKQNILLAYIKVLGYSDALQQAPLINYLSPTLVTISN